ncbi:MAG: biotin--[acetyl-CoA-carboxylase] ligase [Burkholderiales bacterium]|nr:biotin--[acetyl-CoA-carboxylase] ligase [Burkholderiales bacterium]
MIIRTIQTLNCQSKNLFDLATSLCITPIQTLEIISKINLIEDNLIIWNDGVYSLTREINFLSEEVLLSKLKDKNLDYKPIILDEVNSTNSYVLNHITQFNSLSIISCELQSAGKGRLGKIWNSRLAHDITMTTVHQLPITINLSLVPIAIAVAINRALKTYNLNTQIKWPNDIYYSGNKICGILVENVLRNKKNNVIIGIGIDNIKYFERNQLIVDVLLEINTIILEYKTIGSRKFLSEWLDNCIHYKQLVSLTKNGLHIISGIHSGVGENGEIFIANADGVKSFNSSAYSLIFNK